MANEVPACCSNSPRTGPVDVTFSSPPSMEEERRCGGGYLLTKASMEWFAGHYLAGGGHAEDPRVSPLLAPLHAPAGAPPALVIPAELHPLRDEG